MFPVGADSLDDPLQQAVNAQYSNAGVPEGQLLEERAQYPAGDSLNDWMAFTLACAGQNENYEQYLDDLEHFVTQQYMQPQGGINGRHRLALTVMALGGDPTSFGTASDGTAIDLVADSTWNYAGDFAAETINVTAFALIVLGADDYDVPTDAKYTVQDLADIVQSQQNPDGGFGLMQGTSDADVTAMVLQGLATVKELPGVQPAIDAALNYLAAAMEDNGTYVSYGTDSCESLCQVIIALCELGIDPDQDGRFGTPSQTLLQYQCEDGSFKHALNDAQGDYMTTQQAALALCAMQRLQNGQPGVYVFNGTTALGQSGGLPAWLVVVLAIVAAAVIVTIVVLIKKRGK